jgi:subtilisin family serine protease
MTEQGDGMGAPPFLDLMRPRPTGNVLVSFLPRDEGAQLRALERCAQRLARGGAWRARALSSGEVGRLDLAALAEPVLLAGYGVGLVPATAGTAAQVASVMAADADIEEARPEFFMFPIGRPAVGGGDLAVDDAARTWGVAAVGAAASPFTGRGVRIAVLDSGFDAGHPDFEGREIVAESFVQGETTADGSGHGTHCAGTAAGPGARGNRPRYGVAPEAVLHVGKVLSDAGRGFEFDILSGMAWAIDAGCEVISMSLGRPAQPGEAPSVQYERLGRRALEAGCVIVAAAGNDSARRFGFIAPVAAPANSPSILAVGAVDAAGLVAPFSAGGLNPDGGEVDLAAPGVDVFSAFPRPQLYRALQGTSMACPHVAGVAALWAEAEPSLRGAALWRRLVETAAPLREGARDVGAGLVQAPPGPTV